MKWRQSRLVDVLIKCFSCNIPGTGFLVPRHPFFWKIIDTLIRKRHSEPEPFNFTLICRETDYLELRYKLVHTIFAYERAHF